MFIDLLICTVLICAAVIHAGRRIEWRLASIAAELSAFRPDDLHDDIENIRRYAANLMMSQEKRDRAIKEAFKSVQPR